MRTPEIKTLFKVLSLFIALGLVSSSPAWAKKAPLTVPKTVAQQYKKGIQLFRKKQYEPAIEAFKSATRNPLLHWRSELRMGICHFYLEQYRQAARKFVKIIYSKDNYEHDIIYAAYFYYGTILFFENRLDLAEEHLAEARDSSRQPLIVKEAEALLKEIALFKKDPSYELQKKFMVAGYANEQFGYDTNANITQDGKGSVFNRLTGVINADTPQAWSLTGGIQYLGFSNLFLNSDVQTFDSLLHGPSLYTAYYLNPDHSIRLKHKVGANWFNTRSNGVMSPFTNTYDLVSSATWSADTETTWTGTNTLQYGTQKRDTTDELNASGPVFGLGVDFRRTFSAQQLPRILAIGTKGTYYIYEGVQSQYYEFALSGSYSYSFYADWRGDLLLNGRYTFYPKHPDQRQDTQIIATLASTWSPLAWLDIGPSLIVESNSSNVPANQYFKFALFLNATLFQNIFI